MTSNRRRPPRRVAVVLVALLALALAGCGGGKENDKGADPQAVLTKAKAAFDRASSVHLTMSTDSKPDSGDAVLGANGTLTHQPAFDGKVKVLFQGFNVTIPVVSVDGKVYAKVPPNPLWITIDPEEYGAPDPADFADPAAGISGLLLKLDGLKSKGRTRQGKQVLTTYTGTLAGDLVKPIIPSADDSGDYDAEIGIDESGRIATLQVTGDFFSGSGDVTYDLAFDDYDKNVTVKKP